MKRYEHRGRSITVFRRDKFANLHCVVKHLTKEIRYDAMRFWVIYADCQFNLV